jgi:hypothetical protein
LVGGILDIKRFGGTADTSPIFKNELHDLRSLFLKSRVIITKNRAMSSILQLRDALP